MTDANGLFDKSNFEGLYVYIHSNFSDKPLFEVPQIALDKNIEYVGAEPNGHWVIEAEGSDTLTYGPTDLQYPPYGPDSTQFNWSHNKIDDQFFHLLIECVTSFAPIAAPTSTPTASPTRTPTFSPSVAPTNAPSIAPSIAPTNLPSLAPSDAPSQIPTHSPTDLPTSTPSAMPTNAPSESPSDSPSIHPTVSPSTAPTMSPTSHPISFCMTLSVDVIELDGVRVTHSVWNGLYSLDEDNPSFGVPDWFGIGSADGRHIKYVATNWVIFGDNGEVLTHAAVNDADNYPPIGSAMWEHEHNVNGAIVFIGCSDSASPTAAPSVAPTATPTDEPSSDPTTNPV